MSVKSALTKFAKDKFGILTGGGYSFNLNAADQIAGQAPVVGYDDVEVHNINKSTASATAKLTGGGNKKKSKKTKRKTKSKSKKSRKSKSKRRSRTKSKTKKLYGGTGNYPFEGKLGDFSRCASDKDYAGKQPVWNVKTR